MNVIHKSVIFKETPNLGNNIVIEMNVKIGQNVKIMNNVTIHKNTIIGDSVQILDNTIIGRIPISTKAVTRRISKKLPPLKIGNNCIIGANAIIYTGTTIGNDVMIADFANIREECSIGNHNIIARAVTINPNTKIGNNVKIMDCTHITSDMIIEDHVFISAGVVTTNDNFFGRTKNALSKLKGPYIKRGAMIGANASLLPGVVIGENSIVAVGSVVTKDVPPKKIVMGIPARIVKEVNPKMLLDKNI